MVLSIDNLTLAYPGQPALLRNVSLTVANGDIVCLLGPNGAGKTTLLKALIGLRRPDGGTIRLDGLECWEMDARALGRSMAYVPQSTPTPAPLTVEDITLLGRTPHIAGLAMPGIEDRRIALAAMERLGIERLRNRLFTEISGGERQLVLLARAMAQQARVLLLDEPTANLDFGHQVSLLRILGDLASDGMTIVMTTHFPDHALLLRSRVVVLDGKGVAATGAAKDVLTSALMTSLYRVPIRVAQVAPMDQTGFPVAVCVPEFHRAPVMEGSHAH